MKTPIMAFFISLVWTLPAFSKLPGEKKVQASIELHKKCYEELGKHCKEGQTGPDCYKEHKAKLPKVCHSKEITSFFKADQLHQVAGPVMKSRCLANVLKSCPLPNDPNAKDLQKAMADYRKCLQKNMDKHKDSCAKEFRGRESKGVTNF